MLLDVRPEAVPGYLRGKPSLTQVREEFPREWETVSAEIGRLVDRGDAGELQAYLTSVASLPRQRGDHKLSKRETASAAVRQYLTVEAVNQAYLSATTGVAPGEKLKFGRVNGWVLQQLLFERGLTRKPANLLLTRLAWPLLPQRSRLLPLVRPYGVYCFYSWRLVKALARLIGDRPCLEIAAGDGTLAGFLRLCRVDVEATDDGSWSDAVAYPDWVVREDAVASLRRVAPEVVLCSWPPPGNTFERHVFTTPSVQLYVVISSRHEAAAGDWEAYRRQSSFAFAIDERLSKLVLPPGSDAAVLVFTRRA